MVSLRLVPAFQPFQCKRHQLFPRKARSIGHRHSEAHSGSIVASVLPRSRVHGPTVRDNCRVFNGRIPNHICNSWVSFHGPSWASPRQERQHRHTSHNLLFSSSVSWTSDTRSECLSRPNRHCHFSFHQRFGALRGCCVADDILGAAKRSSNKYCPASDSIRPRD